MIKIYNIDTLSYLYLSKKIKIKKALKYIRYIVEVTCIL